MFKYLLFILTPSSFAGLYFLLFGSPFLVPKTIPNLFAWYDASKTSSLTLSGSNVTTWADISGNAYNLTSATSPTYNATGLNNLPTVSFSGTNQNMTRVGTGGTKAAYTVWAIGNYNSANAATDTMIWAPSTAIAVGGATGDSLLAVGNTAASTGIFVTNHALKAEAALINNVPVRLAYVADGSGNLTTYINGVLTGSGTQSGTQLGTNIEFGGLRGFSTCCDWQGTISEVAMYSRALTTAELLQLDQYGYNKWFPGQWPQNTKSAKFTGSEKILGPLGGFDYEASGTTFSWNVWIRPEDNSLTDYMSIFSKEDDPPANQRGYAWVIPPNGRMLFTFINKFPGPSESLLTISCAQSVTRNGSQWSMLTVTWDGTSSVDAHNAHMYINGTECTYNVSDNNLSGTTQNPNRYLKFGFDHVGTPEWFVGLMDEMSNWSVVLTQPQIAALFNLGRPTNLTGSANLVSWWRMGDQNDSPATIYDRVGSNNLTPDTFTAPNLVNIVPTGEFP